MIPDSVLEVLACPACGDCPMRGDVDEERNGVIVAGTLACPACKRRYTITSDIPSLMPPTLASSLRVADEHWSEWRAVMDEFLRWRDEAWSDAEAAAQRRASARAMHERFLEFCALPEDDVMCLEIGSGSGHLADLLPESVTYVGIDPLPGGRPPGGEDLPQHMPRPEREVCLIQAVGEHLPFRDDALEVGLIAGSLDHCLQPETVLGQARRVLRPGARFGLLQGVSEPQTEGGLGGLMRSIVGALAGDSAGSARRTHLHTFSADAIRALVGQHFDVEESVEDNGRVFIRGSAGSGAGR
ncbi:MAG: methyltransferase domain-containing protein [Armatimonadota bacterium]|nr:methyltransferase domain-containing protein [Armatimonadota bacterium]